MISSSQILVIQPLEPLFSNEFPVHRVAFDVTGREDGEALFGKAFTLIGIRI